MTTLLVLTAWCLVTIPLGMFVGRIIRRNA
jgi:hypothetical protein